VSLSRLLCKPAVLWILDEPFTSLDKGGVSMLTDLMAEHKKRGGMVLLTSHSSLPAYLDARRLDLEYRL
jgi:heme exporter protein A